MNGDPHRKSPLHWLEHALLLSLVLFICGAVSPAMGQTIVNCDAPVQSQKRGLGVNTMSAADFQAIAPGVSWYYNWSANPLTVPAGVPIQFIPMSWNGTSGAESTLSSYLAAGNRPSYVFALNEPNYTVQADMTPQACATAYSQIAAICAPYGIPVVGPHMAIGSGSAQSITAYDPIQKATVTYTFQEPFLQAFEYYCSGSFPAGTSGSIPPAMSTHSYGGYGEVTWVTGTMHTDFPNQKVWLTEVNSGTSNATSVASVISITDYCERTPWIQGYAWFMSRISGDPYNSIFTTTSGSLTPAGQAYVQMPVHLSNLYYRIPGTLQADRYVTMANMNIEPSTDTGEIADMISTAANGSIDYNLQVDTPGTWSLGVRASNATGAIKIYQGSTLLTTVNATSTAWTTYNTTLPLASGTQALHFVLASNNQKISTLQFTAPAPAPVSAYAAWQQQWFTASDLSNPAISGETATPAGDGISNLMKSALNLNPKISDVAGLPAASITTSGTNNYLTLTYTQLIQSTGITYIPEVSGDLSTWNSGATYTAQVSVTNNSDKVTQTVVVQDLTPMTSATKRFMRLKVVGP